MGCRHGGDRVVRPSTEDEENQVIVRAVCCVLGVTCLVLCSKADVGQWKTFTSKREVRDAALGGSTVWAATSGGLFSFSINDGRYGQFTTSEGLTTIDLTA